MSNTERLTSQELAEPVRILAEQFIQRWDKYPQQGDNGAYYTIDAPLDEGLLAAHLRGEVTLGMYLLDAASQGRQMVLDADDEPDRRRLLALARVLAEVGCPTYYEASRRGGHLWFFFDAPLPGGEIRRFGRGLQAYFSLASIELYPKQDALRTGPGSLIRLPFGIHKKSGRRYGFYFPDGTPLAPTLRDQLTVLGAAETVPKRLFELYAGYGAAPRPQPPIEPVEGEGEHLWDRVKDAMSCYAFISRYVELSARGSGLCPFHDDQVASFSVNRDDNYWHCFAGCGAGSIIDFYMLYQQRVEGRACDFPTALNELAAMLLK